MCRDAETSTAFGNSTLDSALEPSLVVRARGGDATAFRALVELNRDRVHSLALRLLNSPEEAAKVTQESFLEAHSRLAQLHGDSQFGAWVSRAAASRGLVRLRERQEASEPSIDERRAAAGPALTEQDGAPWARPLVADELPGPALRREIETSASSLATEYREVLVLRDLEGADYLEIAELTQSTVAAVKNRLHRARLTLRRTIGGFVHEQP
jgi:RNA polymerase sigma-70 factor, ECF subfamily